MKVLIVEDDPSLREGMTELLSELAEVRAASTVAEAMNVLQSDAVDLVLTDVRIAGQPDGGRRIVAAARRALMPTIILSALSEEEIDYLFEECPPDAVVLKPFQLDEVLGQTDRFLSRRREADRYAAMRPDDAQFERLSPGYEVAVVQRSPEREVRWFRLSPGASVERMAKACESSVIVEGELVCDGTSRTRGNGLYVAPGTQLKLSSPSGALGVTVSTPVPRQGP